jgi:hypothetical protein
MMIVWENWLFLCIIYNFFTFSYYFGIPGFPAGAWIYLEFLSEVSLIADIFIRYTIRRILLEETRGNFDLLHSKNDNRPLNVILYILSSLPISFVLYSILPAAKLNSLWVAIARGIKLYRLKQLTLYFDLTDVRRRKESYIRTGQALLYIVMATHFLSCLWLFLPRVDP